MEPVTTEERRARLHRHEQVAQPRHKFFPVGEQGRRFEHHPFDRPEAGPDDGFAILRPAQKLARAFAGEREVRTGMPAPQPRRAETVVGEQEIEDRMSFAAGRARLVRVGPCAHPFFMCPLEFPPGGLGEDAERDGTGDAGLQAGSYESPCNSRRTPSMGEPSTGA